MPALNGARSIPPVDNLDRSIINEMQGGFPLSDRPYMEMAARLNATEDELISRLQAMLEDGRLSRFGPLFNADRMGGSFTLCAMCVPAERFEEVAAQVNSCPQVAHNYEREHRFNLWFVLATESRRGIAETVADIQEKTALPVYEFPKLEEYYIGLHFNV